MATLKLIKESHDCLVAALLPYAQINPKAIHAISCAFPCIEDETLREAVARVFPKLDQSYILLDVLREKEAPTYWMDIIRRIRVLSGTEVVIRVVNTLTGTDPLPGEVIDQLRNGMQRFVEVGIVERQTYVQDIGSNCTLYQLKGRDRIEKELQRIRETAE